MGGDGVEGVGDPVVVAMMVGVVVGDELLMGLGDVVGASVVGARVVGIPVGMRVGTNVGETVVGDVDGVDVGSGVGAHVAPETVGWTVGANVPIVLEHTHTSSLSPLAPHCSTLVPAM